MSEMRNTSKFVPLVIALGMVVIATLTKQLVPCIRYHTLMTDFMGSFFLVFGIPKLLRLSVFVEAYRSYDILAGTFQWYAYAYPFIELGLGLLYWSRWLLTVANSITLVLMVESAFSVVRVLLQRRLVTCACLGAIFNIPITYITLIENLIMGFMAALMLFQG